MRKHLITIPLLLLLTGSAGMALGAIEKSPADLEPVDLLNEAAPAYGEMEVAGPEQPSFRKPPSAIEAKRLPEGLQLPAMRGDYFCDVQDYTSGTPAFGWKLPDEYGDDLFNMRFTSNSGYHCTLMVAWFLMYGGGYNDGSSGMAGTPDMKVYLWTDDGFGFPGVKLDSTVIPWADINAAYTAQGNAFFVSADFTAAEWVFTDGEEFHLGYTVITDGDDTLSVISDAGEGPYAGEERASEFYNGTWGSMLNDWGEDYAFFIMAERCCGEIPWVYTYCHPVDHFSNASNFWRAPSASGVYEYAQRFSTGGPDTLKSVDIAIYDDAGHGSAYDDFGDNDVIVRIYADDGSGYPGAMIEEILLPAGSYASYPAFQNVALSAPYVYDEEFHVGVSTNGVAGVDYEAVLSSDGTDGSNRTTVLYDTGGAGNPAAFEWETSLDVLGLDVQFVMIANICEDEYPECASDWCYNGLGYLWSLPDRYGDVAQAQRFTNADGLECQLRDVSVLLYWHRSKQPADGWNLYSVPTVVTVYQDVWGLPGTTIGSITLQPEDYGISPPPDTNTSSMAWLTIPFQPLDMNPAGAYWIAFEPQTADTLQGIQLVSDAGGGECSDSWAEDWGGDDWHLMTDGWGVGQDWAMVIESEVCCIPWPPPSCSFGSDWTTKHHDMARTGQSVAWMDDSWCDLTLNWHYEHPTQSVSFTGPVQYGDKIICAFTTEYVVFDIFTGAPEFTYTPAHSFPAGDVRCAPTVTMIQGHPNPVMFVAGGTNEEVHAVDFVTGTPLWQRAVGTVGPSGMFGNTRWGVFTVLDIAGTDRVFWGTENGYVVGVDALTGALMPGYPVNLGQAVGNSGATDGSQLFYGTYQTGLEGDLYAVEAATGAINWQLSTVAGLQGAVAYEDYRGDEGFSGGISYDAQWNYVYANSRVASGDHPADGMFYRLDAASGNLVGSATIADRCLYSTPTISANRIYMAGFTRWASPPAGGDIYAINKGSGYVAWAAPGGPEAFPYYCGAVLSCERAVDPQQLFTFGYSGFMSVFNADNGDELWRRRVETPGQWTERGMAGALMKDGDDNSHLVYADLWGNLYDLTKQGNRPRLEFQTYNAQIPVEFGPALSYIVPIPDVFANTGCADLEFTAVNVDESQFGPWVPDFSASYVRSDVMARASSIADDLQRSAFLSKYTRGNLLEVSPRVERIRDVETDRTLSRTAAGFPPFLNAVVQPTAGSILPPGDTMDLVLDVIQAAINRGPQSFYLQLGTNDPDFFLNEAALMPQMKVTLVGGCLQDTTTLMFGNAGANERLVSNTVRIGNGDWGDGPAGHNGMYIDGDGASYYQGSYCWAVDKYRIATHSQDWTGGGGEADAFVSMQPDPNWCDNDCKPFIDLGVTLGYITNDGGLTYSPITGDMVCASYLDSVQNFDLGGGWDWTNFGAPFDNDLTMGLYCVSKTFGAVDVPELASVTLDIMEISERNGRAVDGWYLTHFFDCDNGGDTIQINRDVSAAWTLNWPSQDQAWGTIKIPFGCEDEPLINIWGTYGNSDTDHGFWDWSQYWDTAFWYSTHGPGAFTEATGMHAGDEEAHITVFSHDFGPYDTLTIGVAQFGLHGLTNAYDPDNPDIVRLARTVNKWAGFGRGDVNNDDAVNLADIIYLAGTIHGGPGAIPFQHLSDVNADGAVDVGDLDYLIAYYFDCGPCPQGVFIF